MSKKSIAAAVLILTLMNLAVTANGYAMDIEIPVTNGYGNIYLGTYSNPFPWTVTVHATGWITEWIESPQNGSWRIRILVNDNPVFDQSDLAKNQKFDGSVPIKRWSKAKVHVDAWWSEKANTTLKAHAEGSI